MFSVKNATKNLTFLPDVITAVDVAGACVNSELIFFKG